MSEELERLREENAKYHKEMEELNAEMDKMLLNRDASNNKAKKKQKGSGTVEPHEGKPYELRQAIARNEQLRKERLKWYTEITHSDTAIRIAETKNELGVVDQKILAIKEDIRGLENIKKNQQHVVDVAKHADDEVRYLQSEHRQEVNEFREQWRALNEDNKHAEKVLTSWQNKYHTAMEKVKLGLDATDVAELRSTVDSQGTEIEELQAKLESLQVQHQSARKGNYKGVDAHTRERARLEKELDAARATLVERERELKLSYARGNRMGSSAASPTTTA